MRTDDREVCGPGERASAERRPRTALAKRRDRSLTLHDAGSSDPNPIELDLEPGARWSPKRSFDEGDVRRARRERERAGVVGTRRHVHDQEMIGRVGNEAEGGLLIRIVRCPSLKAVDSIRSQTSARSLGPEPL
jgi:hypothetical protein